MTASPTIVFAREREVVLEDRPVPTPAAGQLLVRTQRSLISTGTELAVLTGEARRTAKTSGVGRLPSVPGYSNVGVVEAVGTGVDDAWVGRRVASHSSHRLHVTVDVDDACAIPAGVSDEAATFFMIGAIVMNGLRRSGLTWGEAAAVYGLGLLGQMTVRLCRIAGARPVFAIDPSPTRRNWLPSDSAVHAIDPQQEDIAAHVERAMRGRMADVVFEVTGIGGVIAAEFAPLREQGRMVLLGSPRDTTLMNLYEQCHRPSVTIIGAHNSSHPTHWTPHNVWVRTRHVELFFDLVAAGELDPAALISRVEPYHRAPQAYRDLLDDRTQLMGIVLDWSGA